MILDRVIGVFKIRTATSGHPHFGTATEFETVINKSK